MDKNGEQLDDGVVTAVGPDSIRLDLFATRDPNHYQPERCCLIIDLHTARCLALALVDEIKKAEVQQARKSK